MRISPWCARLLALVCLFSSGVAHAALRIIAYPGMILPNGDTYVHPGWVSADQTGHILFVGVDSESPPTDSAVYTWNSAEGVTMVTENGATIDASHEVDLTQSLLWPDGNGGVVGFDADNVLWRHGPSGGFQTLASQGQPCPNDAGSTLFLTGGSPTYLPKVGANGSVAFWSTCAHGGLLYYDGAWSTRYAPGSPSPPFPGSTAPASWDPTPGFLITYDGALWGVAISRCDFSAPGCPSPYNGRGVFYNEAIRLWMDGTVAPGYPGGVFAGASLLTTNAAGKALIQGTVNVNASQTSALYILDALGAPRLVVKAGAPAPGIAGGTLSWDYQNVFLDDFDRVVFRATINGVPNASSESIWRWEPGTESLTLIARSDQPVQAGGGFINHLGTMAVNREGRIAYSASTYGQPNSPEIVFRESDAGVFELVAIAGMPVMTDQGTQRTLEDHFTVGSFQPSGTGVDGFGGWFGPNGELLIMAGSLYNQTSLYIVTEPPVLATVRAVEVTQAVQDWRNSVTLVAGKRTFARVFMGGDSARIVQARLRAYRDGAELPDSPFAGQSIGASMMTSLVPENARPKVPRAMLFELPPSWMATEGDVEIVVEAVNNAIFTCADKALPADDDCKTTVHVVERPAVDLRLVGYDLDIDGTIYPTSSANAARLAAEILTQYPTARVDWTNTHTRIAVPGGGSAVADSIVAALATLRLDEECFGNCRTFYYGYHEGPMRLGLAEDIPGNVAMGPAVFTGYWRYTQTHELGHTLGLEHAVSAAVYVRRENNSKNGACTEVGDENADDYPFWEKRKNDRRYPVLSFTTDVDETIYGFDPTVPSAVSPEDHFDLMSYCDNLNYPGHEVWPSSYTYDLLRRGLYDRYNRYLPADGVAASWVQLVGSAERQRASLITAPALPADVLGEVVVENGAGDDLYRGPALIGAYEQRAAVGDEVGPLSYVAARYPAELSGVASVVVYEGTTELQRFTTSAHSPVVSITTPAASTTLAGDDVIVSWTMSDADGDALLATVGFSPDGGTTWRRVVVDASTSSAVFPRSFLRGASDARLRVDVSDGMRVTRAEVGPLSVSPLAPEAFIEGPNDGDLVVRADTIILRGVAVDAEDGVLGDAQLAWSSDLAGPLGTGRGLVLAPSTLGVGEHIITLTATDAAAETGTATISLRVVGSAPTTLFDRSLRAEQDLPWVAPGAAARLRLVVRNDGPNDAAATSISALLPAQLSVADAGGCSVAGSMLTCAVGALAVDGEQTFEVAVSSAAERSFTLDMQLGAADGDPRRSNDILETEVEFSSRVLPVLPEIDEPDAPDGEGCSCSGTVGAEWLVLIGVLRLASRRKIR